MGIGTVHSNPPAGIFPGGAYPSHTPQPHPVFPASGEPTSIPPGTDASVAAMTLNPGTANPANAGNATNPRQLSNGPWISISPMAPQAGAKLSQGTGSPFFTPPLAPAQQASPQQMPGQFSSPAFGELAPASPPSNSLASTDPFGPGNQSVIPTSAIQTGYASAAGPSSSSMASSSGSNALSPSITSTGPANNSLSGTPPAAPLTGTTSIQGAPRMGGATLIKTGTNPFNTTTTPKPSFGEEGYPGTPSMPGTSTPPSAPTAVGSHAPSDDAQAAYWAPQAHY